MYIHRPQTGDKPLAAHAQDIASAIEDIESRLERAPLDIAPQRRAGVRFAKLTAVKDEAGTAWTDFATYGFVHHVYANPTSNSVGTTTNTGTTLYLLATPRQDTATIGFRDLAVGDVVAYITIPATVAVPTVSGKYFTGQIIEHIGATGAYQDVRSVAAYAKVVSPNNTDHTGWTDWPTDAAYARYATAKSCTSAGGGVAGSVDVWVGLNDDVDAPNGLVTAADQIIAYVPGDGKTVIGTGETAITLSGQAVLGCGCWLDWPRFRTI